MPLLCEQCRPVCFVTYYETYLSVSVAKTALGGKPSPTMQLESGRGSGSTRQLAVTLTPTCYLESGRTINTEHSPATLPVERREKLLMAPNDDSFNRTRSEGYRNIAETETTGSDSNIPSQEQIFVNRDLNLSKVLSM